MVRLVDVVTDTGGTTVEIDVENVCDVTRFVYRVRKVVAVTVRGARPKPAD